MCQYVQVWSHMSAACATMQAAAGVTWRLTWTDTTQKGATCAICAVKNSNPKLRWKATDWATQMKVRTRRSVTGNVFSNAIAVTAYSRVICLFVSLPSVLSLTMCYITRVLTEICRRVKGWLMLLFCLFREAVSVFRVWLHLSLETFLAQTHGATCWV